MTYIGDHLKTARKGFFHHGIYVGDDRVIHYSGFKNDAESGVIEEVTLEEFCRGYDYDVVSHPHRRYSRKESVRRARSRLGEKAYSVVSNNCEHFVNWCIEGDHQSNQVDAGTALGSGTLSAAVGATARVAVASAGSVAGLSGAGTMSGLATIGSCVGGGAVAGLGVLGGAGGLAAASLVANTILADDEELDEDEREARSVGRKASYAGAATGTAGSVVALSLAGEAGLSASGITTGLAAMGQIVGGGMAAGVALSTAIPVATATAVGYTVYKFMK